MFAEEETAEFITAIGPSKNLGKIESVTKKQKIKEFITASPNNLILNINTICYYLQSDI